MGHLQQPLELRYTFPWSAYSFFPNPRNYLCFIENIFFVWIRSSHELQCDVTKKQAFSGKQERWVVEFSSQSRALLLWQEPFISSGATVYLTVPLLYPFLWSYWDGCCQCLNSFLCALSFWINQAKPALEDFASSCLPRKEPITQNSKGTVFLVNHIHTASIPFHLFVLTIHLTLPSREDLALALLEVLGLSLGRWGRCEVILVNVLIRSFLTC